MKIQVREESPILQVLQQLSPDSSRNTLKSWVEKGRVTVDGFVISRTNILVRPKQEVAVSKKLLFADEDVKILYEDAHIVVIDKPTKLLSVATDSENDRTVHSILKRRKKKPVWPVHRLDRDTSGVMLFAYTEAAKEKLKVKFAAHDIKREYIGIVEGHLTPRSGIWKSMLQEDEIYYVKSSKEGKLAITHYEVTSKRRHTSLVRFRLETGRKNQIRVHASEAGHPLIGDHKYGAKTSPFNRLCLHAHILGFKHPTTGKEMTFVSPLPALFTQLPSTL